MKFKCSHKALSHALDLVTHVIDANVTLPVLNNILVRAEGKKVFFSATNLEMAVNYWIEAAVVNEGAVTIPAKLFSDYVSLLREQEVECAVVEGLTLSMSSAGSKTKIKCIAAEEYPTISPIDDSVRLELPIDGISNTVAQVSFAASFTNTRPVLSGVYLEADGKDLFMVATDSFRLSEKKLKLPQAVHQPARCIVPARAIIEFARLCSKEEGAEQVELHMGKNQILFQVGRVELYSRLIEGNFPNYRQILPKDSKTSASLDTEDLTRAVKRVNLFARENNSKVLFTFESDRLRISTPDTQVGTEEGELPIALSGEPGKIALNSEFVLDFLSHAGEDLIFFGISDDKSPAVLRPNSSEEFLHVIMPLKL
ncbi:MAG: DNA polymerase III subunit beta [bacterium]|nr:DNA polymerase III subunit beta [bacterium]